MLGLIEEFYEPSSESHGSPQDRVQSEPESSNDTLDPPTAQCQPWQQQQSDELTV